MSEVAKRQRAWSCRVYRKALGLRREMRVEASDCPHCILAVRRALRQQFPCERCGCPTTDTAGMVTVQIGKVQTLCGRCGKGLAPRWHRVIRTPFPLQHLRISTAPSIPCDLPRRHCHPLPVTPADAAMA